MMNVYADGSGIGLVCVVLENNPPIFFYHHSSTHNVSEYYFLLDALAKLNEGDTACIYLDSLLVVEQMNGGFDTNAKHLKPLLKRAKELIVRKNLHVEIIWVPREDNLAGRALEVGSKMFKYMARTSKLTVTQAISSLNSTLSGIVV